MKISSLVFSVLLSAECLAQSADIGLADTSAVNDKGKVTLEGYVDSYYAYDFNKPARDTRPYFVSMNRHNEISINLAYLAIKYTSDRVRAKLIPGFGTYVNANYASEPGTLRNIIEANAGIKVFKDKSIWIDAGVLGSPHTNESAISKDHLTYTRSFAPEYVPYYLAGIKLTIPLTSKLNTYLYLVNGWQQIVDKNKNKAVATQLEYSIDKHLLINWNTYVGKESSASDSTNGMRYFTDFYFVYQKNKWSATSCFYIGRQQQAVRKAIWWQLNFIARYNITQKMSVTGRVEYFADDHSVQIEPIVNTPGFKCSSASLGLNFQPFDNILVRLEGRTFASEKKVFVRNNNAVSTSNLITSNITVWF